MKTFHLAGTGRAVLCCASVLGQGGLNVAHAQGLPPALPATTPGLPSAGSILQSNPFLSPPREPKAGAKPKLDGEAPAPEASADDAPRMQVARIVVDGVPAGLETAVAEVVAPYRERPMSLAELRHVAIEVTQVLLDHGETISYAYLPRQSVVNDVIHLAILHGHIESATLGVNHSLVRDRVLQAYLNRGLTQAGDVKRMQRQLDRMSDLPGLGTFVPVLSPGATAGGSVLSVNAQAGARVEAALVGDNAGQRITGRNRIGVQLTLNSPLGLGDRLQAIGFASPDYFQTNHESDGGHTLVGRVSYDLPVGASGARAGMAVSRVNYQVGGEPFGDLGLNGHASVFGLYGSYPIVGSDRQHLAVNASVDYKRMSDSVFEMPNARSAKLVTLGVSGDRRGELAGRLNLFEYSAALGVGYLSNQPDWNLANTRGRYVKATQSAKLTQVLAPSLGLYLQLSVDAQQASRNLDSAEKMAVGGPYAVRAYGNDTLTADTGFVASASVRASVPGVTGLTVQAFYDHARVRAQKFAQQNTTVSLAGPGFGFDYVLGKRASVSVSYAMRARRLGLDSPRAMT